MTRYEQFTSRIREGVAVVHPPSEVDLSNADELRTHCLAAVDVAGPRVVVDLAETTFLDSTALSVFVGLAKKLEADGGWLRLASANSSVGKILALTRLDTYLGNYASVDEAMRVSTRQQR